MQLRVEKFNLIPSLFLKALSLPEVAFLKTGIEVRNYKQGELLFSEGELAKGIFYMRRGIVSIYKTSTKKNETFISTCKKGVYFGYNPLFSDDVHAFSARAEMEVLVSFINEDVFIKLLDNSPKLIQAILSDLAKECGKMYETIKKN